MQINCGTFVKGLMKSTSFLHQIDFVSCKKSVWRPAGRLIVVSGEIVVIKLKRCGSKRHLLNRIL